MSGLDAKDFERAVEQHRAELHRYCYRLLGAVSDADDALQETLLDAWKGRATYEGRAPLRAWLYRIATHACWRFIGQRPQRTLPPERGPSHVGMELDPMLEEPIWLEPYPEVTDASFELRESLELAFVAALQHLPALQRAALVLCDVLDFSAAESAEALQTTVAAVNSALQRGRATVKARVPPISQQAALRSIGEARERELIRAFIAAWAEQDVAALVKLLTDDVVFSMPPIPTWFAGREAVARFFERVLQDPWRLVALRASGQLAFAGYQGPDFRLGALPVLTLRGDRVSHITGFLAPSVHRRFLLPER